MCRFRVNRFGRNVASIEVSSDTEEGDESGGKC